VSVDRLVERFCRYARIDTQAQEHNQTRPSSPGQVELGRMLCRELRELGVADADIWPQGTVVGTVPGNERAPVVAWIAHMDTSPEAPGHPVRPVVRPKYQGGPITYPANPDLVLRPEECPELLQCIGHTLITSDGTTLLGADDKCGVAVIMEAVGYLLEHPQSPRPTLRICFTCDEEIGRGVEGLDLDQLGAQVAYTLDGAGAGEIDCETFSADLAEVVIRGVNIHPSIAKGRMVNAVRLAGELLARLPGRRLAPESSEGREGFLHPYRIEGGVAEARMRILLRDFETARLGDYAELVRHIGRHLELEHPGAQVEVHVTPQYRNMAEGLRKEPRAVALAEEAMRRAGLEPKRTSVRGGTDGSRLTEMGLPTPNLSCGEHNPHALTEWTSAQEMEAAVRVLIELAAVWARETR